MSDHDGTVCPHCLPWDNPFLADSGRNMLDHIEAEHNWLLNDIRAKGYLLCGTCWESTGSYQHRNYCEEER